MDHAGDHLAATPEAKARRCRAPALLRAGRLARRPRGLLPRGRADGPRGPHDPGRGPHAEPPRHHRGRRLLGPPPAHPHQRHPRRADAHRQGALVLAAQVPDRAGRGRRRHRARLGPGDQHQPVGPPAERQLSRQRSRRRTATRPANLWCAGPDPPRGRSRAGGRRQPGVPRGHRHRERQRARQRIQGRPLGDDLRSGHRDVDQVPGHAPRALVPDAHRAAGRARPHRGRLGRDRRAGQRRGLPAGPHGQRPGRRGVRPRRRPPAARPRPWSASSPPTAPASRPRTRTTGAWASTRTCSSCRAPPPWARAGTRCWWPGPPGTTRPSSTPPTGSGPT